MRTHRMIGIGEILWDIFDGGKQMGGAPANFAFHCNQLGNEGLVISRVGDDDYGREILENVHALNIGGIIDVTSAYPTGTVTVTMNEGGIPDYVIHEGAAWDHLVAGERHRELVASADAVCFGSLASRNDVSAEAVDSLLAACSDRCVRLFDINLRQHYYSRPVIKRLLNHATVLKLNEEELETVAGLLGYQAEEDLLLERLCRQHTLDLVILTRGGAGSRLYSPDRGDSTMGVIPVEVVDTVGAGDAFTAAVATGLCRNMQLEDMHTLATRVAACVCSKRGATPEIPPIAELLNG